jgi:hypothetical protein
VLSITRRLLLAAAVTLALAPPCIAGADVGDPVAVVASIAASGTTAQEAAVSSQYGAPLQVKLLDAYGQPVQGATVTFSLGTGATGAGASFLGGGGQASALSNASGLATSPPFVANGSPGRFVATASTADSSTVVPFALVNHASSTTIVVVAGSSQDATAGTRFRRRLRVRVVGADLQPLEGAVVTFSLSHAVSGAGATFPDGGTQATAITDGDGRASSPALLATTTAGRFDATASTPVAGRQATFRLQTVAGRPASIAAGAASGQIAVTASRFGIPLSVTVSDANKNPVAGAVVRFTAPSAGASGRFRAHARRVVWIRTNAAGIAVAPLLTANDTPGGYVLIARVAGTWLRTAFALVNEQRS